MCLFLINIDAFTNVHNLQIFNSDGNCNRKRAILNLVLFFKCRNCRLQWKQSHRNNIHKMCRCNKIITYVCLANSPAPYDEQCLALMSLSFSARRRTETASRDHSSQRVCCRGKPATWRHRVKYSGDKLTIETGKRRITSVNSGSFPRGDSTVRAHQTHCAAISRAQ